MYSSLSILRCTFFHTLASLERSKFNTVYGDGDKAHDGNSEMPKKNKAKLLEMGGSLTSERAGVGLGTP